MLASAALLALLPVVALASHSPVSFHSSRNAFVARQSDACTTIATTASACLGSDTTGALPATATCLCTSDVYSQLQACIDSATADVQAVIQSTYVTQINGVCANAGITVPTITTPAATNTAAVTTTAAEAPASTTDAGETSPVETTTAEADAPTTTAADSTSATTIATTTAAVVVPPITLSAVPTTSSARSSSLPSSLRSSTRASSTKSASASSAASSAATGAGAREMKVGGVLVGIVGVVVGALML